MSEDPERVKCSIMSSFWRKYIILNNKKFDMISYLGLISFQLWLSKHPGIFDRKSCEILCFQLGPALLPLQFQICYKIGNKVFDCFCIPQGIFQYKNGKILYYLCNCICLLQPSQCVHRSWYIPWICLGIFLKWNKRLINYLQNGTLISKKKSFEFVFLKGLVTSLRTQKSNEFEWIVRK